MENKIPPLVKEITKIKQVCEDVSATRPYEVKIERKISQNEYESAYEKNYPGPVVMKPCEELRKSNSFTKTFFIKPTIHRAVDSSVNNNVQNVAKPVFTSELENVQLKYNENGSEILPKQNVCQPSLSLKNTKLYKLGERGSGVKARGTIQDFYKLRDQCLANGTLFKDPEFPATYSSLFFSKRADRQYEWKRPKEIVRDPQLFVKGFSRFDVKQGQLGDCWFLAAIAALTFNQKLFLQVVPDDQGFTDKYAGIFHFRFWQYGKWIDVVVDDRLPTCNGQFVFLHSAENNEFWSALLEKAYAKLNGSYEALIGGLPREAMEDFSGGLSETYELNASPSNLFNIIMKAHQRSSLISCYTSASASYGLVGGHAYSITSVKHVDIQTSSTKGKVQLIRVRNPWGNETEWTGPWSDKSAEWRCIPESKKKEMGLTIAPDGEFWMTYNDFKRHLSHLEICNLTPDALTADLLTKENKKCWETSVYEGSWVRGVTAGGCISFMNTFSNNPQYRITLTDVDEDDDDNKCTVIIALMQKNRRAQRNVGCMWLAIGFALYHLPDPDKVPKPLNRNFFTYNRSVAPSPIFVYTREVNYRFKLPPGTYCIVPSTYNVNEEAEYVLRVFSEKKNNMEENDEELGYGDLDNRVKDNDPLPDENIEYDKIKEFFLKLAGDDMEVDWMALKAVLDYAMKTEIRHQGFNEDICRSMVAMMDADLSGKLGFEEFKMLWTDIRNWKAVFKLYDKDGSGQLSAFELREALNSAGYKLNNHILNVLVHRYGSRNGCIAFNDFIMCAVRLKTMIDLFREKDPKKSDVATFTLEEWLQKTVYS